MRFEILQIMSPPEDVKFSNVRGNTVDELKLTHWHSVQLGASLCISVHHSKSKEI